MIAACTNCPARYQLEDAKVPRKVIKVRCPACHGVFSLDGTLEKAVDDSPVLDPVVESATVAESFTTSAKVAQDFETSGFADPSAGPDLDRSSVAAPESESLTEPLVAAKPDPQPEVVPSSAKVAEVESVAAPVTNVATLDEPAPIEGGSRRRRRCKEEMMARALVSDILVYNRETRDAGLAEGNLLEALGGEIKKSWELYKEKVTPEVANSTNYFREALNEILAEGDNIF